MFRSYFRYCLHNNHIWSKCKFLQFKNPMQISCKRKYSTTLDVSICFREKPRLVHTRNAKSIRTCEVGLQTILGLSWSHRKFWNNITRSGINMIGDNSLILNLSVNIDSAIHGLLFGDSFYFLFVYIQNSKLRVWRKLS